MNFIHLIFNSLSDFSIWSINSAGYFGIFFTMILEGFSIPIPSEVILPLGGYIASKGTLNVLGVILAGSVGGTLGSLALYYISMLLGRGFIKRWGKYILISDKHLDTIEKWFGKYGNLTVFTMRLLPVVRGLISVPAGIAKMKVLSFTLYTFLGSLIWSAVLTYFGFQLGLSGVSMDIIWIVVFLLIGITFGIYFGYRYLKRYLKFFTIFVSILLGSFFVFFIFYSLYEAYVPIKVKDLNYTNQQKIEKIDRNFSFYAVGNTFYNIEFFDSFLSSISTPSSKSFVVDLGNVVYSGDLSKYKIFVHEMTKFKLPFLVTPGPRDFQDGGYKNYYTVFGNYDYTFHAGDAFFVSINNSNDQISKPELDWISDRFSSASTYKYRILLMHFPASWMESTGIHLDRNSSDKLEELLKSKNVNLVISTGKNKIYSQAQIPYLIVGGSKYAMITVNSSGISAKIDSLPSLRSNFNQVMQDLSIYVYTILIIEWPIIGLIGIGILILWFLWKWYRISVKIEKK